MNLTSWMQDEYFSRGQVRYLKEYRGEPCPDISKRFYYSYVLCIAFVRKTKEGRYIGIIKKEFDNDCFLEAETLETIKLKVDIRLVSMGYKINKIG